MYDMQNLILSLLEEIFKVFLFPFKDLHAECQMSNKICWLGNSWKIYSENNLTNVSVVCKLFKVWVKQLKMAEFISRVASMKGLCNFKCYWKTQFMLSILSSKYVSAATQKKSIRNSVSELCAKMKYQSVPDSTYSCSHVSLRKIMTFFPQKLLPQ